jgi:hypothetical protein
MKESELNIWLENTNKHLNNQCVLFFRVNENDIPIIMNNLKLIYHTTVVNIKDLKENKRKLQGMNLIILSGSLESIENMKLVVKRGVIYIEDINSVNKLISLINIKSFDFRNEIKYESIQKVNLESLLTDNNINIKNFVLDRLNLLKKINCNFEGIDIDFLITCINNYSQKKILFASFAQLLFRISGLDFESTTKYIGGSLRKILGTKSKPINRSRLVDLKINQLKKNFRVYDLNENIFITDTKIKIAQELVKLNIKELDVTRISKITDLPLKKIETMYREAFLG